MNKMLQLFFMDLDLGYGGAEGEYCKGGGLGVQNTTKSE